ncbi:MAG: 16S rRNA (cytosine(1402)-N(4))-methyltransferase RsmH [Burkholderiales bacterium]|jgi:16S rRNA (cytosine1402-N4)-methyltransferase|nr:16S rRNA (cytosine(1402)-N(4))-methyltransferase RsmH [Burkholderiales bacterium]
MEKALSGNTHVPVLLTETLRALAIAKTGIYVDGTFGRGGHTRAILSQLGSGGRVIGIDRDPDAAASAKALTQSDSRFAFTQARFSRLDEILESLDIKEVDGILLDLGTSSPQIDDAARGFSFRFDAPLDMRMNPAEGESAASFLASADESLIKKVLKDYGEERFAPQIAKAIIHARRQRPLLRTRQLVEIIEDTVGKRVHGDPRQSPATRSFQALRIKVNEELEELRCALPKAASKLKAGGRLAVISFHSLEDRMVKQFIAKHAQPFDDNDALRHLPIKESALPKAVFSGVSRAVKPGDDEIAANPRARSAVLRAATRSDAVFKDKAFGRASNVKLR